MGTEALRFLLVWMAGWVNHRQLEVIDYLKEENLVLQEQLTAIDGCRSRASVGGIPLG